MKSFIAAAVVMAIPASKDDSLRETRSRPQYKATLVRETVQTLETHYGNTT